MNYSKSIEGITYPEICKRLNIEGITHRGKVFEVQFIHKMIQNKKYTGIVETNGET